ncbi:hypothetical protein A4R26_32245 [Niastella populi]|uniref:Uncharacterized protein n=1 Tax=Niastella populi TaxID=550983 RepID=A0A1V9EGX2_9BACT|nr:hypothetical protein A4R26_32245 [Niastella populi]
MELICERYINDKAAGSTGQIGNNKYTVWENKKRPAFGILSRGINGTYPVECLALIAWNNRHLWCGRVALIGGTDGTYTVEYSASPDPY